MNLESSVFTPNSYIPARYTCDGGNHSPPLIWKNTPVDTKSFVVVTDDPDAQAVIGKTFDHWVIYDLPKDITSLSESLPPKAVLPDGGHHGLTTRNQLGYFGPCPPPGVCHRYFFQLFAVDTVLELRPGKTKAEVLAAMTGHILAKAELIGLYRR
ncbi:YbhB/YbcL family Raf kinase inhibitor-like protein [Synechococcus sp. PCC 6312]|uniref:YbhB/YbcL family Raf kinase inhibitor-like protein n=1 Tax=Synechococcus sp. (strain ATCC 27167 / PCC 6312) TaxID=195253 RepID=UPI00029F32C2|nr:YbhB/YbcL family Raf kinase inhibitor-like protein [Synechococcus sp. PCC 6312]AFY61351.1 phospholipid-binding protein, PBP family [Synechococcus sp. PCC 6312]